MHKTRKEMIDEMEQLNIGLAKFQELSSYRMMLEKFEIKYDNLIAERDRYKREYEQSINKLKRANIKSDVFDFMLAAIDKDPILKEQWTDLLMTLKLVNGEVETQINEVIEKAAINV